MRKSILAYLEKSRDHYSTADGQVKQIDRTLIDSGFRPNAVFAACAEAGLGVQPIKGDYNFKISQHRTATRIAGDGWEQRYENGLWYVLAETTQWKRFEHDRWMTGPDHPGCG